MKVQLIAALLQVLCVQRSLQEPTEKLKFSYYYEALCPFCTEFFNDHFYGAYLKIGSYLDLELIPYGNTNQTKVNGSWEFKCAHGPQECAINKIFACGLAKSNIDAKKVEFVSCIESQVADDSSNLKPLADCGIHLDLDGSEILKCAQGPEGNELLNELGKKQDQLNPKLYYVPYLVFNDKHDAKTEQKARKDFFKTVCELLSNEPPACSTFNKTDFDADSNNIF